MEVFDKRNQLTVQAETDNYFEYTLTPEGDLTRISLGLPVAVPVFKLAYTLDGARRTINLYPTLQFLYSHHIHSEYITREVKDGLGSYRGDLEAYYRHFLDEIRAVADADQQAVAHRTGAPPSSSADAAAHLGIEILVNHIRQSPQYTMAALAPGSYLIGMKDQFNVHDLPSHPLRESVAYIADELGFILYCKGDAAAVRSVDAFGPYYIEQYIVMEALSKQEVAQNVLDYYVRRKALLEQGVESYAEAQGQGFICWRFINERHRSTAQPLQA